MAERMFEKLKRQLLSARSLKTLLELGKLFKILSCIMSKKVLFRDMLVFFFFVKGRKVGHTRKKSKQDDKTSLGGL